MELTNEMIEQFRVVCLFKTKKTSCWCSFCT